MSYVLNTFLSISFLMPFLACFSNAVNRHSLHDKIIFVRQGVHRMIFDTDHFNPLSSLKPGKIIFNGVDGGLFTGVGLADIRAFTCCKRKLG